MASSMGPKAAGMRYSTVGLELVLSILAGFFAGRWLDGKFDTAPTLQLVGFVFGCVAGFRAIYRAAKKMNAEAERDESSSSQTDRDARFKLNQDDD